MTLTNYKLFAIRPKATTNLCTNPSFETGTTGYTTGGTNTIATSATVQRRGVYSCKCTYGNDDLTLSYAATLTAVAYVGTIDVYIPTAYDGTELTLTWTGYAGASVTAGKPDMTIRNHWQRISAYITPVGGDLVGTMTLSETGTNGTAGVFVYVDGVQIETGTAATTYLDGDLEGFINSDQITEFYWRGQLHASQSTRTSNTRAGGDLIDISTYCKIILLEGLGVAPVDHVAVPLTSGGETYLYSNYTSRYFTLKVVFEGSHIGDIQAKRKALLNLIKPDVTGYAQPLILRYQGYTAAGLLASEPVDIKCQYISGLDSAPQMRFAHFADITFRLSDVALEVDGDVGAVLEVNDTLVDADYIVKQDSTGVWSAMAGVTGTVMVVRQNPVTKAIYMGGTALNIGGDADADYLAMWDETAGAWVAVVAGINGTVHDIQFDPVGNMYICGAFTDLGDANGDRIVKIDTALNITSLGVGANNTIRTIAIGNNGYIYVGGDFTSIGGVATTGLGVWDGSTWAAVGTGVNNIVYVLKIDRLGNLILGGQFTLAGGVANTIRIAQWDGSVFTPFSTGANSGIVWDIYIDENNNVYTAGSFSALGGVACLGVGMWNGSKWNALGAGTNGTVYNITKFNNNIILSGNFTSAGAITVLDRIAEYLGNGVYKPLDIELPGTPLVYSLVVDEQKNMYVGYDTAGTAIIGGWQSTTITTNNAATYPVLEFTGIGTLKKIHNYENNRSMVFDGLTLVSGEVITLDLRTDKLTMTSTFRGNVKNYLVKGSNLDFPLIPGDNNIGIFMTDTDASAKGVIRYKTRLHGLDAAQYE